MAIAATGVTLVVLAFLMIYFVLFPTSSPKPFRLSSGAAGSSQSSAGVSSSGTSVGAATGGFGGTWSVSSGSQGGYRVREKLGFLPAESDAVGRTSSITGSATLAQSSGGVSITAASFTIAVNTLKSDQSRRDERIRSVGLESDQYPTATFKLTTPLKLSSASLSGSVAHVRVTGVFSIHGVAKRETVPVEMTVTTTGIVAVGSLTFPWSEFGMTAPSIGGLVNVSDKAKMEFDLRLKRS